MASPFPVGTFSPDSLSFSLRILQFMLLDLGVQRLDNPLQASQPVHELSIERFPALTGCATGTWEYTIDLCTGAIGAWLLLVAFDLAAAAGYTGARI